MHVTNNFLQLDSDFQMENKASIHKRTFAFSFWTLLHLIFRYPTSTGEFLPLYPQESSKYALWALKITIWTPI